MGSAIFDDHPTPWRFVDGSADEPAIMDACGKVIVITEETAASLIRAVNNHRRLVSAVRALIPAAVIASEMLATLGKASDAASIDGVVNLSQQFLTAADGLQ